MIILDACSTHRTGNTTTRKDNTMPTAFIATSNDERITQDFIRSTAPTNSCPVGTFRYDYSGYWGCDSHCTLDINVGLIICTENPDNEGTSITNMAEHLATRICYEYKIDPREMVWVEHYPERGDPRDPLPPSWDLVAFEFAFDHNGVCWCLRPKWRPITHEQVQRILPSPISKRS